MELCNKYKMSLLNLQDSMKKYVSFCKIFKILLYYCSNINKYRHVKFISTSFMMLNAKLEFFFTRSATEENKTVREA